MGHRWRGYAHPELYDMINAGPGAAASDPQTTFWQSLQKELAEVDQDLNTRLTNLGSRWEGRAAESAQAGLTPLASWAGDAETGAQVMRVSSENQGEYVSDARARMPEPVVVTTPAPSGWQIAAAAGAATFGFAGPALGVAQQAVDHEVQEAAKNEAEERAVETMQTYESSSTWNRDTLGTFVAPPDVVVATPSPQGSASAVIITETNVNNVNSGSGGGTVPGSSGTTGSTGSVAAPTVGADQGSGTTGSAGGGGGGNARPPSTTLPPATTTPSTVFTPPAPSPGPGPLVTPSPGPLPSPTSNPLPPGGNPFQFLSAGDSNASDVARRAMPLRPVMPIEGGPFAGRSGPGGIAGVVDERVPSQVGRGGAIGENGVVRSGPGAANAANRGGNGVFGPAGRRAEDEEDDEHFSPDYLLEEDDVFGDDRKVSPAVLGE
jgi:hypothetical protein